MYECIQILGSVLDEFSSIISCSVTYFLEVSACISLKVANKRSPRGKKLLKFRFLVYFSKARTDECDPKI